MSSLTASGLGLYSSPSTYATSGYVFVESGMRPGALEVVGQCFARLGSAISSILTSPLMGRVAVWTYEVLKVAGFTAVAIVITIVVGQLIFAALALAAFRDSAGR